MGVNESTGCLKLLHRHLWCLIFISLMHKVLLHESLAPKCMYMPSDKDSLGEVVSCMFMGIFHVHVHVHAERDDFALRLTSIHGMESRCA